MLSRALTLVTEALKEAPPRQVEYVTKLEALATALGSCCVAPGPELAPLGISIWPRSRPKTEPLIGEPWTCVSPSTETITETGVSALPGFSDLFGPPSEVPDSASAFGSSKDVFGVREESTDSDRINMLVEDDSSFSSCDGFEQRDDNKKAEGQPSWSALLNDDQHSALLALGPWSYLSSSAQDHIVPGRYLKGSPFKFERINEHSIEALMKDWPEWTKREQNLGKPVHESFLVFLTSVICDALAREYD